MRNPLSSLILLLPLAHVGYAGDGSSVNIEYFYDSHCTYSTGIYLTPNTGNCYEYSWPGVKSAAPSWVWLGHGTGYKYSWCRFYTDDNCNDVIPDLSNITLVGPDLKHAPNSEYGTCARSWEHGIRSFFCEGYE